VRLFTGSPPITAPDVKAELVKAGYLEQDLADLVVKDDYGTKHNGLRHLYLRQRWQGIEIWNGDIAVHRASNGNIVRINNSARAFLAKQVNAIDPVISAQQALGIVLSRTLPGAGTPALVSVEDGGREHQFDGTLTGGTPINVQLYLVPLEKEVRLAWNVNHYTPDGSHWWNIRIDALTGQELDRNDWVSQCGIALNGEHEHASIPELPPAPAAPNDYNIYPWPLESPSHGPPVLGQRALAGWWCGLTLWLA
jgi:extracellular elastinolytic metalloproteinase